MEDVKTVTIHEAKTHLSRLIREVLAGEDVVIARGKTPLVRICSLEEPVEKREPGALRNLVEFVAEDFDAPLEDFREYEK